MPRAFILVMDSFGIGAAPDASKFGDEGANTFAHIAQYCVEQWAKPLAIPHLLALGLGAATQSVNRQQTLSGIPSLPILQGAYGYAVETSFGKDTPSGHWEMAGVPVLFDWGYFPPTYPSFPDKLLQALITRGQLPGILGNKHASGTDILEEHGREHLLTGKPIVYTSADSVFQIAAHEETFGLARLYALCDLARELVDEYHIGRVIARPFLGEPGKFYRTGNRRDLTTPPHAPTLLDKLKEAGREVIAIGKIADIFAHRGMTKTIKATGNEALFEALVQATQDAPEGSLTFVNFVDFDMLYGHRRDPAGYAQALEVFDALLPRFQQALQPGDIAIITADHGCDPLFPGSDHTRECVPILLFGPNISPHDLGKRMTFADIGQSVAKHLQIAPLAVGTSFI